MEYGSQVMHRGTWSIGHGSDADSHLAYRQSIMLCTMSSLFWMEKLMKLVSTRM